MSDTISEVNVQGKNYGFACSVARGTCSTPSDAWVKNIEVPGDVPLVPGMMLSVSFEHGNDVGEAEEQTLYSSDQAAFYSDSGMAQVYAIAPGGHRDIKYTGTGNVYKYFAYVTVSVQGKNLILKDSRGHYAGRHCYNDGDTMLLLYDGVDLMIQNSDIRQVSDGYKVMSDGSKEYTKSEVDDAVSAAVDDIDQWTVLGGFKANISCPLPSGWKEVIINTYIETNNRYAIYTYRISHEQVKSADGTKVHSFYSGYGYASSDYGGSRVDISEKTCSMNWFRWVGVGYDSQATMTVRYR